MKVKHAQTHAVAGVLMTTFPNALSLCVLKIQQSWQHLLYLISAGLEIKGLELEG